jgi:ribosomal protein S18 acetylase RimI-like enzyme
MRVRSASEVDLPSIALCLGAAYRPVIARMPQRDAEAFVPGLPLAVERYAARGTWLLVELQSQIVGAVAFFGPGTTNHPLFQGNVAHIQLLGVAPSQARRGVGRALVQECIATAQALGADELLLQTSQLMLEARSLYERLGFVVRQELQPVWEAPTYLYARHAG